MYWKRSNIRDLEKDSIIYQRQGSFLVKQVRHAVSVLMEMGYWKKRSSITKKIWSQYVKGVKKLWLIQA